jgi:hypothetical protein
MQTQTAAWQLIRMQKVEVERLKAGVKQMRTMNQRFKHKHMHNFH